MNTNQPYEEKCTIEQPVEQIMACKDVHLEASDNDQLDRLINISKSNENFFVANSNDYFAYKSGDAYTEQNGVLYQLDKNLFISNTAYYLTVWRIPTP